MDYGREFQNYATKHLNISSITQQDFISSVGRNSGIGMPSGSMTPYILEERTQNITQMDVFSRLMQDRIIFFGTGVDDRVANMINAQLLFLENVDKSQDIQMYVNSPGGGVYAGLSIYDTMNLIDPDVSTTVCGLAASMGIVIASSGAKGKRYALKHSRLMQHQPLGGAQGQASDIEITAREILKLKKELYEILAENSGQPFDKIQEDCDRDHWMIAEEAKEYGMIDEVVITRKR